MKMRCLNPKARNWSKYGGAGITVCKKWVDSFSAFLADMGPRPPGTSIDRIDGRKGYSPGNCRWATDRQQNQNRKTVRLLTIGGETACLSEWARRAGISDTAMLYRVRRGLVEAALLRPSHRGKAL